MNLKTRFETICHELVDKGWTIQDEFFEPDLIRQLASECINEYQQGNFKKAGVGRGDHQITDQSVRSDHIRWLERGLSPSVDGYLDVIELMRCNFNEQLFSNLDSSENHFTYYASGAFYQKHLDQFQSSNSRVISSVLYLNPDWKKEDSGELRLHLNRAPVDIAPIGNRMVLFMSADVWHEVLPTKTERLSLTGWFKRQSRM